MDNIAVILPAFNESKVIGEVISNLKKEGFSNIIIVDDCSSDDTAKISVNAGAVVLSHPINRGAGAATATGLEYVKREGFDKVIVMDSDGQHSPKDAKKLLSYSDKYDVVIGSRLINSKGMPLIRRAYNKVGSLITYFFFGLYVYDSQSGFKLFNRKAINKIQISFDRYEFCSEVIGEIHKRKLSFKEVPIKVIYTEYSLSKGQSFKNGVKMLIKFMFRN